MKRSGEIVAIAFAAITVFAVVAWNWGSSSRSARPRPDSIVIAPAGSEPPANVMIDEASGLDPWAAMKLPRASHYAGGPPSINPASPEPPLAANQVICPMVRGLTLNRDKPDEPRKHEIVGRTIEMFGLLHFDLSRLSEPPEKAVLRACAYYIENTSGYVTPVRLVFYRMTTEWDDSATYVHASARDDRKWNGDSAFSTTADAELTPIGSVDIPNPAKPGFNLEVDITPVVAAWLNGEFPNHGLLMRCDFAVGWSTQANLATRQRTSTYAPQILCTMPTDADAGRREQR